MTKDEWTANFSDAKFFRHASKYGRIRDSITSLMDFCLCLGMSEILGAESLKRLICCAFSEHSRSETAK